MNSLLFLEEFLISSTPDQNIRNQDKTKSSNKILLLQTLRKMDFQLDPKVPRHYWNKANFLLERHEEQLTDLLKCKNNPLVFGKWPNTYRHYSQKWWYDLNRHQNLKYISYIEWQLNWRNYSNQKVATRSFTHCMASRWSSNPKLFSNSTFGSVQKPNTPSLFKDSPTQGRHEHTKTCKSMSVEPWSNEP